MSMYGTNERWFYEPWSLLLLSLAGVMSYQLVKQAAGDGILVFPTVLLQ